MCVAGYMPQRMRVDGDELILDNACINCSDGSTDLQVIQCNASNVHGYQFVNAYINFLRKSQNLLIRLCCRYIHTGYLCVCGFFYLSVLVGVRIWVVAYELISNMQNDDKDTFPSYWTMRPLLSEQVISIWVSSDGTSVVGYWGSKHKGLFPPKPCVPISLRGS